jgi:hypothetical protein
VEHTVRLRGDGAADVPAFGLADAEHQVEKEIRAAWPRAQVQVLDVARPEGPPRIVEEFRVRFRVTGSVAVSADSPTAAVRDALRTLRERFAPTRYQRIEWRPVDGLAEGDARPEGSPSA